MIRFAVAYAVLAGVTFVLGLVPIEDGPFGILAIVSPYLALAALLLIPVAVVARSRGLALATTAVAVLFAIRLGGEWWSFSPADPASGTDRRTIDVATWNTEAGAATGPEVVAMLNRHPVDVLVLPELTPVIVEAIRADAALVARYPYRELFPTEGVAGIGLLSAYPIANALYELHPVRIEARLDVDGRAIVVLGAHPFPSRIQRLGGIPVGLEPHERNADLDFLRTRINELGVEANEVLILGDFNTAPTEAAFGRLVSGLHDAHAEVGVGPGWTWRPASVEFLGTGLLRIDLVLSTGTLVPQRVATHCPSVGDHCLLEATLELLTLGPAPPP